MTELFQIAVLRIGVSMLATLVVVSALIGLRQVGRLLLRNLKPVALAALLPLAALLTDFAGEKNTNMPLRIIQPVASQTFSSCGAVTNSDWLARGAYEDWFYIPATNWWARMPGGGWIDRLRIFSFGGFQAKDASGGAWTNYPPPFPQKFSMAPMANWHMLTNRETLAASHESLFWHGVTESNTQVMTWQDGLYERCATNLVSFQAELFNNGSVAYRYDGSPVATNDFIVPLELPFDRDGDGLENSVDPDPLVAGPDAHGTSAEWYNVVCSNVFAAVEGGGHGVPALPWRDGVNSNAYYFVDVVAERGPSPICFTGDRESRLGNPALVALAGETNRVPLLIGINYAVTSDTPFTVSFPVDCLAVGTYSLENASFPFSGGECRCGFDDPDPPAPPPPSEQPSFSVSFSNAAVIFEDTYQDKPGVWKPRRSTRVWVSVSATGGPYGGSFTLVTENLGKLTPVACGPMVFPPSMDLGPYGLYRASFLCEGATQSDSAGDVRMSGTFVENETGASFRPATA